MKLILTPTGAIENVQGVPHRVWYGTTEEGVEVKAWIATVQPQTADPVALRAFEEQLRDMPYQRQLVSFDLRLAL